MLTSHVFEPLENVSRIIDWASAHTVPLPAVLWLIWVSLSKDELTLWAGFLYTDHTS